MPQITDTEKDPIAFPELSETDMAAIRCMASVCEFEDGQTVFQAGDADVDFFVVESGEIEVLNPTDDHQHIVTHGPGQFAGDIDMLTRRPVVVTIVSRGKSRLLRVPGSHLRELLNRVPRLGEKLICAFQERRRLLQAAGVVGLKVVGPGKCKDTTLVREFLNKNFVPFTWFDSESPKGKEYMRAWGSPKKSPVIECGDGTRLINPSLQELAHGARVWHNCPTKPVDLAIIGGGPAGMTAAVYAASEGIDTLVVDRLGPGGQAGGSSKIENFIGFPSGLSGTELATRSVLQMLKFGATMVAPVNVKQIEPRAPGEEFHVLNLDCGTRLQARVVLVAAGVSWRRLEAEGAERFEAAGIHHACTWVEATLYDKQDVAVVGAGNSAGQAAMFLAECCRERRVHMIIRKKLGPGMSEYLVQRIRATPNIVLHEGAEIASASGKRKLERVTLKAFDGNGKPGETLDVGAVFVFIGAEPGCGWLPEAIARDQLGYILTGIEALRSGKWPLTDRQPCDLETTLPGILAAGDIRSGSTKRVGFAVGDGSLAVTCVHRLRTMR